MVCGYSRSFNRKIEPYTDRYGNCRPFNTCRKRFICLWREHNTGSTICTKYYRKLKSYNRRAYNNYRSCNTCTDGFKTYICYNRSFRKCCSKNIRCRCNERGRFGYRSCNTGRKYLSCKYSSCNRCGKYSSRSTDTFKYSNSSRTFSTGYNTCSCYTYSITGSFKCGTGDDNNKSYIT